MVSDDENHLNKHDEDINAAMAGLRGLASAGGDAAGDGMIGKDGSGSGSIRAGASAQNVEGVEATVQSILRKFENDVTGLVSAAGKHFQDNDHATAAGIWRAASDAPHNDATATYSYGMCLQEGYGVDKVDPRQAVKYFARAARKGHPWAQYALAHAFHKGEGVEVDAEEALTLYTLAARNGIPPAPFNVANMYAAGEGTDKDDGAAIEWYKRAAELGDPKAQFALGARHCSGRGVEVDWEAGYEYHVDAANAGYAPAQFNTGTHYFLGQGVEQNLDTAVQWFQKAADQGMPQAQVNLARMFLDGYGVSQDRERGISLLRVAAEDGKLGIAREILREVALPEDIDKETVGEKKVEVAVGSETADDVERGKKLSQKN
jgi:TPR repeat protein